MRVAILGAGYAGVALTRRLESRLPDDVEIVLVDENATHLVQHELHHVIRRPELADEITLPLSEVVERASVRESTVEDLDPERGEVELTDGTLSYDVGAVCLGAAPAYYDLPGVVEHSTPLKRLADAEAIHDEFCALTDPRVVVGGAGLAGVQAAGELAALADERGEDAEILLLEQMSSVAPQFPPAFRRAVREELDAKGIEVRTDTTVEGASADEVETAGGEVAYDQFVWTGGIAGPAAMGGDRPVVGRTLQLADRTFAVGDAARVVDADGEAVPASAQSAVREAAVAAENIARLVEYERGGDALFEPRLASFRFESPGWLVSVGDGAVAKVGPTVFRGRAAKALKASVGVGYLSSIGAVRGAVDRVNDALGIGVDKSPEEIRSEG